MIFRWISSFSVFTLILYFRVYLKWNLKIAIINIFCVVSFHRWLNFFYVKFNIFKLRFLSIRFRLDYLSILSIAYSFFFLIAFLKPLFLRSFSESTSFFFQLFFFHNNITKSYSRLGFHVKRINKLWNTKISSTYFWIRSLTTQAD